jgi:hypothetical protein
MATNRDFRDLFSALNAAEVRYLVVGGYAITFHARPRFTKDLDIWVDPDPANAERTFRALAAFGAPMRDLKQRDFSDPELVLQIGMPPNRIDVLMGIQGVAFPDAWERRVVANYADCPVAYLSKADLIRNKRAVGRPQDLEDVRELEGG